MKIKSNFALLDVLKGDQGHLKKRIEAGEKIPITIEGIITGIWGDFDGVSREFEVKVSNAVCEEANQ